jgi:hypothetical protein
MSRFETIQRDNWEEFTGAPAAVLMLGKTDCGACVKWTEELVTFLEDDGEWEHVRFGKLLLDTPGLGGFKRANAELLKEVNDLPFTIILKDGEVQKTFVGSGVERLQKRLEKTIGPAQ